MFGLLLAEASPKHLKVMGHNVNEERIRDLGNNNNINDNIEFTLDPSKIKQANFVCIIGLPLTEALVIRNK